MLNRNQRIAVETTEGPLLIIAGAGAGKTTVLVNRVAYLVSNGVDAKNILLLTFTNAAANNMKTRASKISNGDCSKITACTYHSFCNKLLRLYKKNEPFSVISPQDEADVVSLLKAKHTNYETLEGFPEAKAIVGMFSESVNKNIPLTRIIYSSKYKQFANEITELHRVLVEYKKEQKLKSFDDLMVETRDMLKENKAIRYLVQQSYKYIMVDEYQDTNTIQEEILSYISSDNIAVVGDDYQSIYAFRGSDVENFMSFPDRHPNCEKIVIDINYRSTRSILALANMVMDKHADFGFPKNMLTENETGSLPKLVRTTNQNDETEFVLAEIKKLLKDGADPEEIAVIERGEKESAKLEMLFEKENIPFRKYGGVKFMDRECVRDMIAIMRIYCNPYDETAWFRILKICDQIGDVYGQQLAEKCRVPGYLSKDFLDRNKCPAASKQDLFELYLFFQALKKDNTTKELCNHMADNYMRMRTKEIKTRKVKDESKRTAYMEQLQNDKKTLETLKDMVETYPTIQAFLDAIVLDQTKETEEDGKITVTTVHSSKGMEWSYVFLLNCIDGIFPNERALNRDLFAKQEELRCFYVALTRAKKKLWIMAPYNAVIKGKTQKADISSFMLGCDSTYEFIEAGPEELPKYYIKCSFHEKEKAKKMGAKWDFELKQWYFNTKEEKAEWERVR